MINPEFDYRQLRLDVALDRLDHRVWLPFCENPLVLVRIWVHPGGVHTFDLLITRDDPDDVSACRITFTGGQLHVVRFDRGTVERMVQAVTKLRHPPGVDLPYTPGTDGSPHRSPGPAW